MELFDRISSQESEDGTSLSPSQDGQKIDRYGQDHVPASHSQSPAEAVESTTKGTCGPSSLGLSPSAALTQSLGNRLRGRLDSVGSMEYLQTWKEMATPAGLVLLAHTASGLRICEKEYIGWQTPTVGMSESGRKMSGKPNLLGEPRLADWPKTPTASDGEGGVMEIRPGTTGKYKLRDFAQLASWPTTTTRDSKGKDAPNRAGAPSLCSVAGEAHGTTTESSNAKTANRAVLAPEFSLWLMGFPEAWAQAAPGAKDWQEAQAILEKECSREAGMQ